MKMAEFGGLWRSLAYPESLFWVNSDRIFVMLFITRVSTFFEILEFI